MDVRVYRQGLSPRTRGSLELVIDALPISGPIPADAGEPSPSLRGRQIWGAYPRGRGGAAFGTGPEPVLMGLSPRTRGSLNPST